MPRGAPGVHYHGGEGVATENQSRLSPHIYKRIDNMLEYVFCMKYSGLPSSPDIVHQTPMVPLYLLDPCLLFWRFSSATVEAAEDKTTIYVVQNHDI